MEGGIRQDRIGSNETLSDERTCYLILSKDLFFSSAQKFWQAAPTTRTMATLGQLSQPTTILPSIHRMLATKKNHYFETQSVCGGAPCWWGWSNMGALSCLKQQTAKQTTDEEGEEKKKNRRKKCKRRKKNLSFLPSLPFLVASSSSSSPSIFLPLAFPSSSMMMFLVPRSVGKRTMRKKGALFSLSLFLS